MFVIDKEVEYFSLYEDGMKIATVGFIKLQHKDRGCHMEIQIKGLNIWQDGEYPLLLTAETGEMEWGTVSVRQGSVCEHRYLSFQKEFMSKEGTRVEINQIGGLVIIMDKKHSVITKWKKSTIPEGLRKRENVKREKQETVYSREIKGEIQVACETGMEDKKYDHKWEKLCNCYRSIHPFGDKHIFISIEPKDLAVLGNADRKLANNSFLLHGFYNYRHIIVGPDRNQPLSGETHFCLGVPGIYYEREKMVAIMFGFEGFECEGPVETGKNGYYMREVSLS